METRRLLEVLRYCETSITEKMPAFAFAEAAESVSEVTQIPDDRRRYGVSHLTPQQQIAGQCVLEMDDILEEYDQKREPHGSTEIVMYVSNAVYKFLAPLHAFASRPTGLFSTSPVACLSQCFNYKIQTLIRI